MSAHDPQSITSDVEALLAIRARLDFVQTRLDAGDTSGARAALSRIISVLPAPHERHIMAARASVKE
jgi:hypothetical protein